MFGSFIKLWKARQQLKHLSETEVKSVTQEIVHQNSKKENCQMILTSVNQRRKLYESNDGNSHLLGIENIVKKYYQKMEEKTQNETNDIEMETNHIANKRNPLQMQHTLLEIASFLDTKELMTLKQISTDWVKPCIKKLPACLYWLLDINVPLQPLWKDYLNEIKALYVWNRENGEEIVEKELGLYLDTLHLKLLSFRDVESEEIDRYLATKMKYEFISLLHWAECVCGPKEIGDNITWNSLKGMCTGDAYVIEKWQSEIMKLESLHVLIDNSHESVDSYKECFVNPHISESLDYHEQAKYDKSFSINFSGKELCLVFERSEEDEYDSLLCHGGKFEKIFKQIRYTKNLERLRVEIHESVSALNRVLHYLISYLLNANETHISFLEIDLRLQDEFENIEHWKRDGAHSAITSLCSYITFWNRKAIKIELTLEGNLWKNPNCWIVKELLVEVNRNAFVYWALWQSNEHSIMQISNECLECHWKDSFAFNNHGWHYRCCLQKWLKIDTMNLCAQKFCKDCENQLQGIVY